VVLALGVPLSFGQGGIGPFRSSIPSANQHVGTPDTVIAHGFQLKQLAAVVDPLENPTAKITQFGRLADGTRTEPDENLYFVVVESGRPRSRLQLWTSLPVPRPREQRRPRLRNAY